MESESRLSHHKPLVDTAVCSLNEVRDTSRVVYNATSKPPRTVKGGGPNGLALGLE